MQFELEQPLVEVWRNYSNKKITFLTKVILTY